VLGVRAVGALTSVVLMLTPVAGGQQPPGAPLLQSQHMVYAGAFRLPAGRGLASFEDGGTSMSFDPANGTLWMAGRSQQWVAEVNIPEIRTAMALTDLATATIRTPFRDVLGGRMESIAPGVGGAKLLGGTLPWLGSLIVSAYVYFDAGNAQAASHFRVQGSTVIGPVKVGRADTGLVSGWMAPIPVEWQAPLGGPALTGQCCIPIISRTSSGPAASVFNPADIGVKSPVPATQVVGYPWGNTTLGGPDSNGTLFNTTVWMGGIVFPPLTRSVLFIGGRKSLGRFCYGPGTDDESLHMTPYPEAPRSENWCYDPSNHDKGTHGYPYTHFVWAYDAQDLVAARKGRRPWNVRPYATWPFDLPFQAPSRAIKGVAYDPATRRLFLTAQNNDGAQPLVHVFTVSLSAPPGAR